MADKILSTIDDAHYVTDKNVQAKYRKRSKWYKLETLNILGLDYRVVYYDDRALMVAYIDDPIEREEMSKLVLAQVNYEKQVINVWNKIPWPKIKWAILHEICHVVVDNAGLGDLSSDDDDRTEGCDPKTQRLGTILFDTLERNGLLVE